MVTATFARHRVNARFQDSRCFIVEPYEPEAINDASIATINSVESVDWCNIVDQLSEFMHWEYDGMAGTQPT